jgi:hypothetical protein
MGEQNSPAVAEPLVEVDRPFGGVGREIGGGIAQSDGHDAPSHSLELDEVISLPECR